MSEVDLEHIHYDNFSIKELRQMLNEDSRVGQEAKDTSERVATILKAIEIQEELLAQEAPAEAIKGCFNLMQEVFRFIYIRYNVLVNVKTSEPLLQESFFIFGKNHLKRVIEDYEKIGKQDVVDGLKPYLDRWKAITGFSSGTGKYGALYMPDNRIITFQDNGIKASYPVVEEASHLIFKLSQDRLGHNDPHKAFTEMIGVYDKMSFQSEKNEKFGEQREGLEGDIAKFYLKKDKKFVLGRDEKYYYYFSDKWGLFYFQFMEKLKPVDEEAFEQVEKKMFFGTDQERLDLIQTGLREIADKHGIDLPEFVDESDPAEKDKFDQILREKNLISSSQCE